VRGCTAERFAVCVVGGGTGELFNVCVTMRRGTAERFTVCSGDWALLNDLHLVKDVGAGLNGLPCVCVCVCVGEGYD